MLANEVQKLHTQTLDANKIKELFAKFENINAAMD